MFAKPRPKKSPLPPPNKKRKTVSTIEEISFDDGAREEYLTGFHKRKLQRIKHAQEEAAKRAREEKLETRKQIREGRRREVAEHVESVNKILRESGAISANVDGDGDSETQESDEWDGFPDKPDLDMVDHEEEYVDEDRYTTVKIESVSVSRDGLSRPDQFDEEAEELARQKRAEAERQKAEAEAKDKKPAWQKKKKKKFRYETKLVRQLTDRKQRIKSQRP
ncbi:hypothetical protein E4U30_000886 [Claviceps sp. LM220 group G6]|nr:hypothetical protein E4U15_001231 [Claviceps sp. LM218 group G6]KAG6101828.1 hypothetical protein E4U30_000886 [Claviceps sp. LM220 group G6]KAG6102047.1 hypothetical protein E4U31_003485 [Claviceps sp. LM219 group G6]KAG6120489.1 hypothetical protein E4U14_003502 [Claviceps sp. LM454 group G7]